MKNPLTEEKDPILIIYKMWNGAMTGKYPPTTNRERELWEAIVEYAKERI